MSAPRAIAVPGWVHRAARLGSTELAQLTGTEQMFPDVAFVAYARPLEPL